MVTLSWPNLHIFKKYKKNGGKRIWGKYSQLAKDIVKKVGGKENKNRRKQGGRFVDKARV